LLRYLNIEVLDARASFDRPLSGELPDFSYQAEGFGPSTPWKITSGVKRRLSFPLILDGRTAIKDLRQFVSRMRGQQRAFWVPAYIAEYELIGTYAAGAATVDIKAMGFGAKWDFGNQFRHICVLSVSKLEAYGVTGYSGTTTETLALSRPLDTGIDSRTIICPLLLMRLASERIDFSYASDEVALVQFDMLEIPSEAPGASGPGVVNEGTRPIMLYEFTKNGVVSRFANYGVDVTANSLVWTAENISDNGIALALEVISEGVELTIRTADNAHLAVQWMDRLNMQNAQVQIYETDADDLTFDALKPLYVGQIERVQYEPEGLVILELSSIFRTAERSVPQMQFQRTCNNRTFDGNCGLVAATFTTTGISTALTDAYVEAAAFGVKTAAEADPDWFALGKVTIGNEVRLCTGTDGANRLYLNAPFRQAIVGDFVSATAGDNKRVGTCLQKFNNLANFNGFPYLPSRNPQFKSLETPKAAGGKKA